MVATRNSFRKFLPILSWLSFLTGLGLGLVFVYSGIAKLMDPKAFARIISQYNLIPSALLPVAAIGLPALELLAGIGLLLSVRGSLSLTFALLVFFVTVLWYGILNGLDVDCGCFSVEDLKNQAGLWQAFYRDLIMIGAIFLLYLSRWLQAGRSLPLPLWVKIKRIV